MKTYKNTIPEHAPPDENPSLLNLKEQTLRMVNLKNPLKFHTITTLT